MDIILSSGVVPGTNNIRLPANSSYQPENHKTIIQHYRHDIKTVGHKYKAASFEVTGMLSSPNRNDVEVHVRRKHSIGGARDIVHINPGHLKHEQSIDFAIDHHGWLARKLSRLSILKSSRMPRWVQQFTDLPRTTGHVTLTSVKAVDTIDPNQVFVQGKTHGKKQYFMMDKAAFNRLFVPK